MLLSRALDGEPTSPLNLPGELDDGLPIRFPGGLRAPWAELEPAMLFSLKLCFLLGDPNSKTDIVVRARGASVPTITFFCFTCFDSLPGFPGAPLKKNIWVPWVSLLLICDWLFTVFKLLIVKKPLLYTQYSGKQYGYKGPKKQGCRRGWLHWLVRYEYKIFHRPPARDELRCIVPSMWYAIIYN